MIVLALRHADRPDNSDDDVLGDKGRKRAKLLARMLVDSGVSVAFRSETERARQTLEPLEQELGNALVVTPIRLGDTQAEADAHVSEVVRAVTQHPDAVVLVVGHTNTLPGIVEGLGGGTIEKIRKDEFDKLFVLSINVIQPAPKATLLKLRYGAAT